MNTKTSLLAGLGAAALLLSPGAAPAQGKAKNVVLFVGDGMGQPTVTATRIYVYGEAGKLQMEKLPRTAIVKTYSLDAQTTDSAPSMSAYMTGVKMRNEVLSMSADTVADKSTGACAAGNGTPVATFLELAKAAGKAVGAVTTTELTHATPAATYAHSCHRDLAYDIAAQAAPGGVGFNAALGTGVDVLMGGGANHWVPSGTPWPNTTTSVGSNVTITNGRPDGRNLVTEMAAAGYTVVNTAGGLRGLSSSATKVLGLFSPTSHLDYELDRNASGQPGLAEMSLRALEVLKRNSAANGDKGFFLMVEGGRIDHALHGTQAQKALGDAAAFDAAIKAVMDNVDLGNTLVVVTADHDHTLTMNGYGQRGSGSHVVDVVRDPRSGAPLTDADGYPYPTLVFGNGPNRPTVRAGTDTFNLLDKSFLGLTAVRTSSETHGGADVPLMAGGADAQLFHGTLDNTAVFGLLTTAAGL